MTDRMIGHVKKYMVLFFGVSIQTFGTALSYHADIGSGPIAVYNQGMNVAFGISVGTASWIMSAVFITLSFLFRSRYLSVATILMTLGIGYMLDFWTGLCGRFFLRRLLCPCRRFVSLRLRF